MIFATVVSAVRIEDLAVGQTKWFLKAAVDFRVLKA